MSEIKSCTCKHNTLCECPIHKIKPGLSFRFPQTDSWYSKFLDDYTRRPGYEDLPEAPRKDK